MDTSCQRDDLEQLRAEFPDWAIEARWTATGTGPDQRYLLAQKDDRIVTAWTAGDLAAEIRRESGTR